MELKNNEAATHATLGMGSSVAEEVDLYSELVAFAELSPEDRVAANSKRTAVEASELSLTPLQTPTTVPEPAEVSSTTDPDIPAASSYCDPAEPREMNVDSSTVLESDDRVAGASPEFVFAGALTRGVCLACGADAGVNDVFCAACGAFVDEAEPTLISVPTCPECDLEASIDDLFCPRCGAALPAP